MEALSVEMSNKKGCVAVCLVLCFVSNSHTNMEAAESLGQECEQAKKRERGRVDDRDWALGRLFAAKLL